MNVEQIEVTITPGGEVSIHVTGVNGQRCRATTADLEGMLGGEVLERTMTPEAYQSQTEDVPNRSRTWE